MDNNKKCICLSKNKKNNFMKKTKNKINKVRNKRIKNIKININNLKTNIEEINNNSNSINNFKDISKNEFVYPPNIKKNILNEQKINNKRINFNDYELNNLLYEEAKKYDKRNYLQFYISLLKTNHVIIFTFSNNDYNSKTIKIHFFLFSFALYYTVNGLFFNDSTMSKIYKDGGKYNFIYQIPLTIFSSLICTAINSIMKYLALSQNNILEIKNLEKNKSFKQKVDKILNCLKIKFRLFFIFTFIFSIIFWYFLGCFCSVYKNTQIHLIKDTLISFGLSFVYPLGIFLIPGILRIYSLKKNKNRKILYEISKIIQVL